VIYIIHGNGSICMCLYVDNTFSQYYNATDCFGSNRERLTEQ